MRLGASLIALVALASTSVVRSAGLFDTGSLSSFDKHVESELNLAARATVTTGCTCYSFLYRNSALFNDQYIPILFGSSTTNPKGWCWQNGAMIASFQANIQAAITAKATTAYTNGSWALQMCSYQCGSSCSTAASCASYIVSQFTSTVWSTAGAITACTYPSANFVPTDCSCGFTCNAGYVQCGTSYCINPATQTCSSGAPQPLKKRDLPFGGRCSQGMTECPTRNGGWECLDTSRDLEACGGCPYTDEGVDCSSIPGANSVACVEGKCKIRSCDRSHYLNGTECVPASRRLNEQQLFGRRTTVRR